MALIDRRADELTFLSSFFSGETKTGLFEAVIVLVGSFAMSVGIVLAAVLPAGP
jgi:hypothetical protein